MIKEATEKQRQKVHAWTGLDFPKSQMAVEDRQCWRQLVARSSVVPLRLFGSRNRQRYIDIKVDLVPHIFICVEPDSIRTSSVLLYRVDLVINT